MTDLRSASNGDGGRRTGALGGVRVRSRRRCARHLCDQCLYSAFGTPAEEVVIDDLRIIGRALSRDEIEAMRTAE